MRAMQPVLQLLKHELVATRLRDGIRAGLWGKSLPGVLALAAELDVSPRTVRRALRQMEDDGLLSDSGRGRSRGIIASAVGLVAPPLRVGIVRHDERLTDDTQSSAILSEIMHSLADAGHTAFFCNKSQIELRHEVRRIACEMATRPLTTLLLRSFSPVAASTSRISSKI